MECSQRTYLQPIGLTGGELPVVPTMPGDWAGIVNFLTAVCRVLDPDASGLLTPGPVSDFAMEVLPGGVALTWNSDPTTFSLCDNSTLRRFSSPNVYSTGTRSGAFILYRNNTNNWQLSKAIVTPHNKTVRAFRWFDKWGQADPGTKRYYWVQAVNQKESRSIVDFARGPLTGPLVTVEP